MSTKGKTSERLTMKGQIHKAYKVMLKLVNPKYVKADQSIPMRVLQNAKGIAFVTQVKAGFVFTGTLGSGIVIAKLPDGSWSGPSSLATGGMGWGLQIGGSVTDSVIILNTTMAVKAFSGRGQIKFGGNISVAAGPLGREGDAAVNAGDGGIAACYSYSHSRGAFAGLSLQGAILVTRDSDNKTFYGEKVSPTAILSGAVTPPENEDLRLLYNTLRVITHSKTPDFEYRDSRTGLLQHDFSSVALDDGMQPQRSEYYDDNSSTLGPSMMGSSSASLGEFPTAAPAASSYDTGAYPAATTAPSYSSPQSGSSGLPPGWQEVKTDQGEVYYWNESLNKTQWERPEPEPAASPPPPPPPQEQQQQEAPSRGYGPAYAAPAASPSPTPSYENSFGSSVAMAAKSVETAAVPASASPAGPGASLASELSSRLSMRQPGAVANSEAVPSSRPQLPERQPSARPAAPLRAAPSSSRNLETTTAAPASAAPAPSAPSASYTLEQVMGRQVPEMDPRRLDEYLRDEDFKRAFGMARTEFNAMPKWKRDNLKKAKSLF